MTRAPVDVVLKLSPLEVVQLRGALNLAIALLDVHAMTAADADANRMNDRAGRYRLLLDKLDVSAAGAEEE